MAVARWTQASARTRSARVARPPWATSIRWKRTPPRRLASARLARCPWERSSTTTSSSPSAWSRSTRLAPRNPAPPATTTSKFPPALCVGRSLTPTAQAPWGPVGEGDPADQGVGAERPEVAAVGAGRPVVAKDQVLGGTEPQVELAGACGGDIGLGDRRPVDLQAAAGQPHPLPRQPHHPLDQFQVATSGEDDQVAAAGWADQRGDGDPLAGRQGGAHAAPLDQHRLEPGPAHGQAGGNGGGAQDQRAGPQRDRPPHGRIIARRRCAAKAAVVVTSGGDIERKGTMRMIAERLAAWIRPTRVVHAHCDLPCGVYDPAQARIEAESMAKIVEKYHASDDPAFRERAIFIKDQRAELVKHHLWVLWTDYFKPNHLEQFPQLHDLFWRATKQAGEARHTMNPADQQKLLDLIDEIAEIFHKTKS